MNLRTRVRLGVCLMYITCIAYRTPSFLLLDINLTALSSSACFHVFEVLKSSNVVGLPPILILGAPNSAGRHSQKLCRDRILFFARRWDAWLSATHQGFTNGTFFFASRFAGSINETSHPCLQSFGKLVMVATDDALKNFGDFRGGWVEKVGNAEGKEGSTVSAPVNVRGGKSLVGEG